MKKYCPFLFILFGVTSFAQDKPYFQQEVNYKINISLDDQTSELKGDESLEYVNNSPDELTFIWFHIWPNAYKDNNTALAKQLIAGGNKKFYFASYADRGYIDQLNFKVNGQTVKTELHPDHIDIIKLFLNEPLKPGGRITIETPFHVKIPIGVFSRLGHIEQQYQITQWYPKPAVYDRLGWHPMPYLNQGEFYSEFGSFDVSITLPKNYVVGATGTLVDGGEEIAWLLKKAEETKQIEEYNDRDLTFPPSSPEMKTLRYQASGVHDFAWFADKRYYVMHDSVILPHSKKKVDTWVMYTDMEADIWKKAAKYVSDAVYYYSLWNGDYPYPHATAVDGALSAGGGMEYPMITVIGQSGNAESLDRVIAHEVGHNWFYGILGSNERDYAWMDEGVNSFNEQRYMKKKYPKDSSESRIKSNIGGIPVNVGKLLGMPDLTEESLFDLGYRINAVRKLDQPAELTASEYTSFNYGTVVYGKTAFILSYLQAYLGEELYDKCAQAYFEKWKFKHPYPADMQKVFEEVSGKDLNWFFKDMITTTNQVDYKVSGYDKDTKSVVLKNSGKVSSPFSLSLIRENKTVSTQWYEGFQGTTSLNIPGDFDLLQIDAIEKMPDINRQNNTLKAKGICKRTEPFSARLFGVVRNTGKTQLFVAPVMGWNNYNNFMLGAAIYNNLLPEKKFEYVLMPMYGFGNKDLAGGASVHYNIHPDHIFQTIRFGALAERYCYSNNPLANLNYNKVAPELMLELKKKQLNSPLKQSIWVRSVNIFKEIPAGDFTVSPVQYEYSSTNIMINEITYKADVSRKINPFSFIVNAQQVDEFVKTSFTANYTLSYKTNKKGLELRMFAGKAFGTTDNGNYFLNMSGATADQDYIYDYVFLGRSERDGFLSHQFAETGGNMKVYTPIGRSNDWLVTFNGKTTLPGNLPVKIFGDLSFIPESSALNELILFDLGINIPIIKDVIEVYCPVFVSKDIKSVFYLNNPDLEQPTADITDPDMFRRMSRMIRFTFNIQKLNPFELVRNF